METIATECFGHTIATILIVGTRGPRALFVQHFRSVANLKNGLFSSAPRVRAMDISPQLEDPEHGRSGGGVRGGPRGASVEGVASV